MTKPTRRARLGFGLAAAAAGLVATVFATVGDGVEVAQASGLRRVAIDTGHIAVWVLLTLALGVAACAGRWTRGSQLLAVAAGATYLVFLAAVFVGA